MARVNLDDARSLVQQALERAGASTAMAQSSARALVLAEAQGLGSHGLSRVVQYQTHLRNGRALPSAQAAVVKQMGATALIDAAHGLAFPACDLAIQEGIRLARANGIALIGIVRSHHCGVLVDHLRPAVAAGMVGLGFANSPAAMPAAGGKHPIFGTNPVAAAFPRRDANPVLIDLSLSEVARGKLMVAAKEGKPIPVGWALDAQGQATTDPKAGLSGSMLPVGAATSPKGAMLALVVELLVTALIGANFGYEASSFFVDEGNQPGIGQTFLLIDPAALAGSDQYLDRIEQLVTEMLGDAGVRLPGERRAGLLAKAQDAGIEIPQTLLDSWGVQA